MCTIYAFCGVLFGLCSLTSLTVLSAVCCLKVCYPAYGRCWMHQLCPHPSRLPEPFFCLLLSLRSTSPGKALPQGNLSIRWVSRGFYHLCVNPSVCGEVQSPSTLLPLHASGSPCTQSLLHGRAPVQHPKRCQGSVLPMEKSPSRCITGGVQAVRSRSWGFGQMWAWSRAKCSIWEATRKSPHHKLCQCKEMPLPRVPGGRAISRCV